MSTISKLDLNNTNGPKYKAVLAWLKDQIISGELKAGEKLPPVRDLAWELGVTPGTVARAYKEAISENLLEATVGRGTFVSAPSVPKTESTKGLYIEEPSGKINLRNTNTTDVGQFVQIAAAMQDVAKTRTRSYVNYPGFEGRSAIYPELVKWMEYVQVVADPGNIVVTHGGQNAIAIALQVILGRKLGGGSN